MSNAVWVAWRAPCLGLRSVPAAFRSTIHDLRITPWRMYSTSTTRPFGLFSNPRPVSQLSPRPSRSTISPSFPRRFKRTSAKSRSKSKPAEEVLPRVPDAELQKIFGSPEISTKLGNRILSTLHSHRLTGTLDAELPSDITRAVSQQQVDTAMDWLRNKYPVDEDAAILARIEREDRAEEEKLVRRAERLGLYKPQSGSYDAELGEEGSPYGKSILKEAREKNEKRLLAEQERKRQEWLDGEKEEEERLKRQFNQDTSLQQYQENALTEGMFHK
jgi:rhomboid-like protein